jgi:hypothetical protein
MIGRAFPTDTRARDLQAQGIADELLEIADDGRNDWMQRTGNDECGGWELNGEHIQRGAGPIATGKSSCGRLTRRDPAASAQDRGS